MVHQATKAVVYEDVIQLPQALYCCCIRVVAFAAQLASMAGSDQSHVLTYDP